MLSKSSAVTLPMLLLGILWWLRPPESAPIFTEAVPIRKQKRLGLPTFISRRDLIRIAPFFVVAIMLMAVNLWVVSFNPPGETFRTANFIERLLGACCTVWFYLYKAFFPTNLMFAYPQWSIDAENPLWWLPAAAMVIVTVMLWWYSEGWSRPFFFAWFFFCLALAPVMGFIDSGWMHISLVADHYQHIAIIGVITLTSAGWGTWHQQARYNLRWAAIVLAILAILSFMAMTWQQSSLYRDAITLYQATLKKNPKSWFILNILGGLKVQANLPLEAAEYYEQALRINPNFAEAHNNLGFLLFQAGRSQEAIEHYRQALLMKPDHITAHNNLANALLQYGQYFMAIEHYEEVLRLNPNYYQAHYNLGNILVQMGRTQEAMEHYRQALQLKPDYIEVYNNLGSMLIETGKYEAAIECYKQALRFVPNFSTLHYNLALAYASIGKSDEAIAAAQNALQLAQTQGQTETAWKIEAWLINYRAGLSDAPKLPPSFKSNDSSPK